MKKQKPKQTVSYIYDSGADQFSMGIQSLLLLMDIENRKKMERELEQLRAQLSRDKSDE